MNNRKDEVVQPTGSDTNVNLLKSTSIALGLALVVLILFILPAEYNIDPTGVGEKIGLTVLASPTTNENTKSNEHERTAKQKDVVEVLIQAGKGVEYKFELNQYQTMTYQWQTDGGSLYLDLHGEPAGDTTGYYESYTIATSNEMSGQFTVPFTGVHGWYWQNKTEEDITVTLTTEGSYNVVGLKQ